tara:strand:- start:7766 stop:8080 length:315 start_codon:yes stop_codon:yes gene_type:complete
MTPAARIGDQVATGTPATHGCSLVSTIATNGMPQVMIAGSPAAIMGSVTAPHGIKVGEACVPHVGTVNAGSAKVFIAGFPAARVGDLVEVDGAIITGAAQVLMG